MCVCVCVCVCASVCVSVCACVCADVHAYVQMCMRVHTQEEPNPVIVSTQICTQIFKISLHLRLE